MLTSDFILIILREVKIWKKYQRHKIDVKFSAESIPTVRISIYIGLAINCWAAQHGFVIELNTAKDWDRLVAASPKLKTMTAQSVFDESGNSIVSIRQLWPKEVHSPGTCSYLFRSTLFPLSFFLISHFSFIFSCWSHVILHFIFIPTLKRSITSCSRIISLKVKDINSRYNFKKYKFLNLSHKILIILVLITPNYVALILHSSPFIYIIISYPPDGVLPQGGK